MTAPFPLLEVQDLHVAYGHVEAVRGVSLAVPEGRVVTLIGPNGAGKTSILSALAGLVRPAGGAVRLDGADVTGLPARLFGLASARAEERAAAGKAEALLAAVGLSERAAEKAANLSYGEQRRVEIARALAGEPRLLLLDEPTAGMNPVEVQAVARLIRQAAGEGHSVLLVEHNVRLVMDVCDAITVLNFGKVIAEGPPAAVAVDPAVVAAYLGAPR